jgi:hypothetical protein
MPASLGTAFAGTTDAPAQDEPLTVQSNDGYFNKTEFMDACQKGLVHSVSQDTAIPQSSHVMLRKR